MKQIQSAPIRPRSINPAIPEGLEEITMRAMQKDLSQRYQSAAEMLRDIDEFKRNPTILFEYKYLTNEVPIDGKKYSQAAGKGTGKKKSQETNQIGQKPEGGSPPSGHPPTARRRKKTTPSSPSCAELPLPLWWCAASSSW